MVDHLPVFNFIYLNNGDLNGYDGDVMTDEKKRDLEAVNGK